MFDEELEKFEKEVYEKDDKKKLIKAVLIVFGAIVLIAIFFLIKSKLDYKNNSENLDKYARDYYEENMRGVNVAAGYSVTLRMLEATEKYDLKYFEECDDKKTVVNIAVDEDGNITKTSVKVDCK